MALNERHEEMLRLLDLRGSLTVKDLTAEFGVSEMTIRRDLERLEQDGLLTRTFGGALSRDVRNLDQEFTARLGTQREAKIHLANSALSLLHEGETLALDAGTTTLALARAIKNASLKVIVVTNSVAASMELAEAPLVTTILVGGELRGSTYSLVGPMAEDGFRSFHLDHAFIAVTGVSVGRGLTNSNLFEAQVKKAMMEAAKQVVVLADYTKLGKASFNTFARIELASGLVTNEEADPTMLAELKRSGLKITLAPNILV